MLRWFEFQEELIGEKWIAKTSSIIQSDCDIALVNKEMFTTGLMESMPKVVNHMNQSNVVNQ